MTYAIWNVNHASFRANPALPHRFTRLEENTQLFASRDEAERACDADERVVPSHAEFHRMINAREPAPYRAR